MSGNRVPRRGQPFAVVAAARNPLTTMAAHAAYAVALRKAIARDAAAVRRGLAAIRRDHDDLVADMAERLEELQPRLAVETLRRDAVRRAALSQVRELAAVPRARHSEPAQQPSTSGSSH